MYGTPKRTRLAGQRRLVVVRQPAPQKLTYRRQDAADPSLAVHCRGRDPSPVRRRAGRGTMRLPNLSAPWGPRWAACGERDYAEPACPRVWTHNDVSLAPTRKVYRLIRAISPSGVLASTFSRVSSRCRLAWKSESAVMLRAAASCSESKPKHQSSLLSFSEAVKRGAVDAVNCAWSGT